VLWGSKTLTIIYPCYRIHPLGGCLAFVMVAVASTPDDAEAAYEKAKVVKVNNAVPAGKMVTTERE
jgi:hypothetical protein